LPTLIAFAHPRQPMLMVTDAEAIANVRIPPRLCENPLMW
jgi:hypothetical protein